MTRVFAIDQPLPGANYGGTARLADAGGATGARAVIAAAEAARSELTEALARCEGLLLFTGLDEIAAEPALLARLSRAFGPEVEDYRKTLTRSNMVHETVPEIFVVSNMPLVGRPPPPCPDPPFTNRKSTRLNSSHLG